MDIRSYFTRPHFKTQLLFSSIILAAIIAITFWALNKRYVTTEDAYVNAPVVQVAAQINGEVAKLYVSNNQYVQKGSALLDLDPRPFELAIEQAKAELNIHHAEVQAARAIMQTRASTDASAKLEAALAAVDLAQAKLAEAELNYSYTHLTAPADGWVTNFSLQVGDAVNQGKELLAFIVDKAYWIDANYLETQLSKIKEGQTASVTIDMYPGIKFTGVVDSISYGTGNVFSLLPPQNATGNWIKITQRIPVRIRLINSDPKLSLRIGTSAAVKIDTQQSL